MKIVKVFRDPGEKPEPGTGKRLPKEMKVQKKLLQNYEKYILGKMKVPRIPKPSHYPEYGSKR